MKMEILLEPTSNKLMVGTNLSVLVHKTKSARDGLETTYTKTETKKELATEYMFGSDTETDAPVSSDDEEIKTEDLTELVQKTATSSIELDSPEDDQQIQVSSEDEAAMNIETEDNLSQKTKLKEETEDAKVEPAYLKAQPSYPNVQQLTKLLVSSFQPELVKLIKSRDLNQLIHAELKLLPTKLNELTESVDASDAEFCKTDKVLQSS
ncbi:hypothetical protein Tco_0560462 [Tanacetum coccineum]